MLTTTNLRVIIIFMGPTRDIAFPL